MRGDSIDFSAEASDRLDTVRSVLALERSPRITEINELFRAVHSLKGLAGLKGFSRLAQALHEVESLLDEIRLSKLPWSEAVRDGLDHFFLAFEGAMERAAESGDDHSFSADAVLGTLSKAREPKAVATLVPLSHSLDLPPLTLSCLSEYEESRLRVHLAAGSPIFTIDVAFPLDSFEPSLKELGARLNEDGEWIATLPQVSGFSAERLAVQLLVARSAELADLPQGAVIRRVSREPAPLSGEPPLRQAPGRTVRLETLRLEALLAEADEARARFQTLSESLARLELGLPPSHRVAIARLRERLDTSLSRLTRQAASIRTVPIALLADRLQRAAQRLLASSGKKAVFRIVGGESEIDRTLADDLADPLLHIVRNALDHGIEHPAERRAAGKPETGTVTLMARSRSSRLLISIADDGRGIDTEAVVRRGRALGWVPEGTAPTAEEAYGFLFRPGFSTASAVSEISGRGVGLDLVAERVGARHGDVRVTSELGRGTRFEIEIANSQAVFDALVVLEEGKPYAFPLASIARLGREKKADHAIPLNRALTGSEPAASGGRISVFLSDATAISVAHVLRQEMIVVRPVQTARPAPFLIGASQGRGEEAILVLDPKRLPRSVGT